MRAVHFAATGTALVLPLCGQWDSMDTDWTSDRAGVTCLACREAIGAAARAGSAGSAGLRAGS